MKKHLNKQMAKRLLMALIGVFFTACTVGLFNFVELGPDPFTIFVNGIANFFHTTYGTVYPFMNIALLIFAFFLRRSLLGIATLFNIAFTGIIADFVQKNLETFLGEQPFFVRLLILLFTLILLCLSSSLYMTADLGVSAYDACAIILSKAQKKISFRFCRIGTDLICVMVGWIFHAIVGIGTVVTAFLWDHSSSFSIPIFPNLFSMGRGNAPKRKNVLHRIFKSGGIMLKNFVIEAEAAAAMMKT